MSLIDKTLGRSTVKLRWTRSSSVAWFTRLYWDWSLPECRFCR
jgi:hypothetical protein